MQDKKNPKADVHRRSGMFFQFGLILSLFLAITAFEWRFYEELGAIDLGTGEEDFAEVIEIPATEHLIPPPPKLVMPQVIEEKDEIELPKLETDLNAESDPEENIKKTVPVPKETEVKEIKEEEPDEPLIFAEEQPEFQGGIEKFYKFLSKNIEYPKQARRLGIEGKVYMSFVVDKDGSLSEVKVTKGIGYGCDEEAVRVIKASPKWKPGKQRFKPVRVRMSLPIYFKLN